jgi:hypothetical protein
LNPQKNRNYSVTVIPHSGTMCEGVLPGAVRLKPYQGRCVLARHLRRAPRRPDAFSGVR